MSEFQIKFIIACIIQSLHYLRIEKIINRDIAMRNIIMDKKSYLNLIDFSFAILYEEKNNFSTYIVPSPFESSPEILNNSIYDYNSDYYRIGVILFYLIFKKNINMIKKINNVNDIKIDYHKINNYSSSCIDFLNKLIISDYKRRIGFKSINELKNHSWFKGFNWEKLEKKKIKSPLKFTKSKFNHYLNEKNNNINIYEKINYQYTTKNYDYINEEIIFKILNLNK